MKVKILKESGYEEALLGLSLSYNKDPKDMHSVAVKLAPLGRGHSKFKEFIQVWIDVTAPLSWWKQMATYRFTSVQSESTMHTLGKYGLTQEHFEKPINPSYLNYLNSCISGKIPLEELSEMIPQGFLQRRIICTNYMSISNMILQRRNHKLSQWKSFCEAMKSLEHYELLGV